MARCGPNGTGTTENSVTVDETLSKISGDLCFGFSSVEPISPRRTRTELGVVGIDVPQYFGHYDGRVDSNCGPVSVENLYGWAEDAMMRW